MLLRLTAIFSRLIALSARRFSPPWSIENTVAAFIMGISHFFCAYSVDAAADGGAHYYRPREPKDRVFPIYVLLGSQKSALPCFDARHCVIDVKAHSCDESVIKHQG